MNRTLAGRLSSALNTDRETRVDDTDPQPVTGWQIHDRARLAMSPDRCGLPSGSSCCQSLHHSIPRRGSITQLWTREDGPWIAASSVNNVSEKRMTFTAEGQGTKL